MNSKRRSRFSAKSYGWTPNPLVHGGNCRFLNRKDSDRYFQIPQWAISSGIYLRLKLIELRLYVFFICDADRQSRETPSYTASELAAHCRINRKYVRKSINRLASFQLILPFTKGVRIIVAVLFDSPLDAVLEPSHNKEKPASTISSLNISPLIAESLNRSNHSKAWDNLSHNLGQSVSENETSRDIRCDNLGQHNTTSSHRPYIPGEDADELEQSR